MLKTQQLGILHDQLPIMDVHTHTSGEGRDGSPEGVVQCMEACGVEKAFLFAPLLNVSGLHIVAEHLDDIKRHNEYIAHFCSFYPDQLLAFAVLNPSPRIANGDLDKSVTLMIEEARRCYEELGIRGVKMVPDRWTADDDQLQPLWKELGKLGMYVAFHCGIFLDERSSQYCRPASYEGVHMVPKFHGHLAHLGWPWVDECIATLAMETFHPEPGKDKWQLKADLSFGCPPDWQVESVRKALNNLPLDMLMYASDCFWPCDPVRYLEQFIYPQLANFETAATLSRSAAPSGTKERIKLRQCVFHDNALDHWELATRGVPQNLLRQKSTPKTPNAWDRRGHNRSFPVNQPRQSL
jgi:predicted TIM-barrel fold metal-dependent hydrolase